ncbi:Gag protein, partial [Phytophthora palmivora]
MDRGEFPHLTDAQFESVQKMMGIFGGDALRSLAAATPAEQVERIEAFDTYERGHIAHAQGLHAPVAEMKPAQPKPLRLTVNPFEGKEGENLHFWVREVELAMDAALISTERLRVAFALSNLGGRAKTWAYTREATTLGCFTSWAQLCQQLRAAFLPANYEYRQRSRFLACKQGKRELHEYIQEMRVLAASLVGNPLPEHIKVTVFMDGLKVGPSRTQLFRYTRTLWRSTTTDRLVHLRRCGKATMHQQAQCKELQQPEPAQDRYLWTGYGRTELHPLLRMLEAGHMQRACPAEWQRKFPSKPRGSRGQPGCSRDEKEQSLGALETRKSSGGLLVVHASVRGYGDPFRILIDSGASTNVARRQTVARNDDKYANALRESEGRGQVSVRLAD